MITTKIIEEDGQGKIKNVGFQMSPTSTLCKAAVCFILPYIVF